MSQIIRMKALFHERLTQAVDEVFGVLGKTITECEDEVTLYKNEMYRLRMVVENLKVEARFPVDNSDPPQDSTFKDEVPSEQQHCGQERSCGLDPEPPQVKEEPEEIWTSPTGGQLQRLEEVADPQRDPFPGTVAELQTGLDDLEGYAGSEPPSDGSVTGHQDSDEDWTQRGKHQSGRRSKRRSPRSLTTESGKHEVSSSLNSSSFNLYKCKLCGENFSSKGFLLNHAKNHDCVKDCICGVCGMKLDTSDSLKDHVQTHRTCDFCGKGFPTSQRLDVHVRIHTGEKPFLCKTCGQQFNQRGSLLRHIKRHKGNKPYCCKDCGKGFHNVFTLKQHVQVHSVEITKVPANQSKAVNYDGIQNLDIGLLGPLPLSKPEPSLGEANLEPLSHHPRAGYQSSHSNIGRTLRGKRPSCLRSKQRSPRGLTLESRKDEVSSGLKSSSFILYSCKVCGDQFTSKGLLLSHAKNHDCVTNCICGVCGMKLDTSDSLKDHVQTHRTCDFCGKGFPTSQRLDVHVRIHTGEKPFLCKTCGQQFNQRGSLLRHIKRHKGKKPYCCKDCGECFRYASNLKQHVKLHKAKRANNSKQTVLLDCNQPPTVRKAEAELTRDSLGLMEGTGENQAELTRDSLGLMEETEEWQPLSSVCSVAEREQSAHD